MLASLAAAWLYSTNTTLMHEVVDGVAAQIEIVAAACA